VANTFDVAAVNSEGAAEVTLSKTLAAPPVAVVKAPTATEVTVLKAPPMADVTTSPTSRSSIAAALTTIDVERSKKTEESANFIVK
jgi:hypothetical protein